MCLNAPVLRLLPNNTTTIASLPHCFHPSNVHSYLYIETVLYLMIIL